MIGPGLRPGPVRVLVGGSLVGDARSDDGWPGRGRRAYLVHLALQTHQLPVSDGSLSRCWSCRWILAAVGALSDGPVAEGSLRWGCSCFGRGGSGGGRGILGSERKIGRVWDGGGRAILGHGLTGLLYLVARWPLAWRSPLVDVSGTADRLKTATSSVRVQTPEPGGVRATQPRRDHRGVPVPDGRPAGRRGDGGGLGERPALPAGWSDPKVVSGRPGLLVFSLRCSTRVGRPEMRGATESLLFIHRRFLCLAFAMADLMPITLTPEFLREDWGPGTWKTQRGAVASGSNDRHERGLPARIGWGRCHLTTCFGWAL